MSHYLFNQMTVPCPLPTKVYKPPLVTVIKEGKRQPYILPAPLPFCPVFIFSWIFPLFCLCLRVPSVSAALSTWEAGHECLLNRIEVFILSSSFFYANILSFTVTICSVQPSEAPEKLIYPVVGPQGLKCFHSLYSAPVLFDGKSLWNISLIGAEALQVVSRALGDPGMGIKNFWHCMFLMQQVHYS